MKRITLLVCGLLLAASAIAQTETATKLYNQAITDRAKISQFLAQDFSAIDSTSMHDLAVLFYRDKDYSSAGTCWEIALQKVKKFGKAYEQILNALSSAYAQVNDSGKIAWLMELMEEYNQQDLLKPCNDYKCKLERAQYYILHDDELNAKLHIKESLELCQTESQRIEVEETYARMLFDVRDFLSCAQYYLSAANRWKGLGSDTVKMGIDLYWAAQNFILASKFEEAEKCSRDAIECFKRQKDDYEKKFYLMSILSLGDAFFCQQDYENALATYQIEMEGYASWMPDSEKHADALEDMAKAEVRLEKFEDAKKHYQAALDIYKALNIDSKYSNTYSLLMLCLRKANEGDVADKMEQEAQNRRKAVYQRLLDSELSSLEITRKYLGSMIYTNSLNTIAGCYFGLDEYANAAEFYAKYSESLRIMLRERFALMREKDRMRVWEEQYKNISEFCFNIATLPDSAAYQMQRFTPTFYDLELLSKGIMLNSSIEFENVLNSMNNQRLKDIYKIIKEKQEEIERLQNSVSEENARKVLSIKQQIIPLEQELMRGCFEVKDYTEYLSYTWKDVQHLLKNDDVAIEFTIVQLSPLDKDTYLLALILTSTGKPVMEVVSKRDIILNLEQRLDLYDNPAYFGMFWGGSLKKHLEGKKRIFFAPNNMLSNVAIEYLKDGEKPFFETHEVFRLSSTKELCRQHQTFKSGTICLFGDVNYDAVTVANKRDEFGKLEFSRTEIDGIASCMKKYFKVKMYDGKKATEQNFRNLSESCPTILHIASHGKYAGNQGLSTDEAMNYSFLALSGINLFDQPQNNDGKITAADVAGMNLRQCDMAVLSACQTALGGQGADGIFGLQRGFKNAGVHTLLMSIKPVHDESTAKLMISFYQGLANGLSKRNALVHAQKQLRDQGFTQGEYWAPFILIDAFEQ